MKYEDLLSAVTPHVSATAEGGGPRREGRLPLLDGELSPEDPGKNTPEKNNTSRADRNWRRALEVAGTVATLLLAVAAVISACNGHGPT